MAKEKIRPNIERPTKEQVEFYLNHWESLPNYVLQENCLNRMFFEIMPGNNNKEDILIKVSLLNDFYSTNIKNTFTVAEHIKSIPNLDERLKRGDDSLVNEIASVDFREGRTIYFYSFATKFCSHHQPLKFSIYDSYVHKLLMYFLNADQFSNFQSADLKDYITFKRVILDFQRFYNLLDYNLKQMDQYLWQLGKRYFNMYEKKEFIDWDKEFSDWKKGIETVQTK